jgi:hypothetical protein
MQQTRDARRLLSPFVLKCKDHGQDTIKNINTALKDPYYDVA